MALITMHDIWERAQRGPVVPVAQFDTKVVFPKMRQLVKKYGIKYDSEQVVPSDDKMMDNIWEAAMEFIVDVGMHVPDTEKLIKLTRDEVEESLDMAPGRTTVGAGKDAVEWVHRNVEDSRPPLVTGGPVCCPVSREINIKVAESYGREPACDIYWPGTLVDSMGLDVAPWSPVEIYTEMEYCAEAREGLRRAGRPGVCIYGTNLISSMAPINAFKEKYYRPSDIICITLDVQVKVSYEKLSLALACKDYGIHFAGCGTGFVGGFFGGPEGAAIGMVVECVLSHVVVGGDVVGLWTPDLMYSPGCAARKPIWVASAANQALARNTKLVWWGCTPYAAYAGAGTDMYMQETAAATLAHAVSGATDTEHGAGSFGIGKDSFGGGIESRFVRDVGHAATRMSRAEANEVVKALLAQYEPLIEAKTPPAGKTFQELVDLDSLKPTPEFQTLVDDTYEELRKLGLDLSNAPVARKVPVAV